MAQKRNYKNRDRKPRTERSQEKGGINNVEKTINNIAQVYSHNPRLVEDAGRLSFAQALGNTIHFGSYSNINMNNTVSGISTGQIPGAARLGLEPSYGGVITDTAPINLATRKIYSFVRHANSGRSNYEAADLMLYLIQMNEIIALYSWFVRLYGITRVYNGRNRYYPKRIVESMGVDFEDLIQNLANFRFYLNVFASKVSSLNVPANFPLYKHSVDMFSNLYLDGTDEKAQTYFFDLNKYYEFDATTDPNGGSLVLKNWIVPDSSTRVKVENLTARMSGLLDSILQNEDMNIMSGDILKAYGSENMLVLPMIEDDYTVFPVYDELALDMIRNASLTSRTSSSAKITQNNQLLVSSPTFSTYSPTNTLGKLISLDNDMPTPIEVLMATRLSLITPITETAKDGLKRKFTSSGPYNKVKTGIYILTDIRIVTPVLAHPLTLDLLFNFTDQTTVDNSGYYASTLPTMFRSFPLRHSYLVNEESQSYIMGEIIGDVQNYTILSKEDLDKQHETALLSLFGI